MPERQSISQSVQLGVETTSGTAVAANKRLQALGIEASPKAEINQFRPIGQKYPALATLGKEWVEADLTGQATFSEMQYPLASVITTPTVVEELDVATPTGAYKYTFDPVSLGVDTPKTFTVEQGDTTRAHRFAYGIVTEFSLEASRSGVELGGTMMGRALQDGVTLTPTPTALELHPVLPTGIDVFLDVSSATLGTTKLTRPSSVSFSISNRYGPLWVLDSANTAWVAHVEMEPTVELKILMQANAEGMARLTQMRDGSTRFLRLEATGANIYTGGTDFDHKFTLDVAGKISDIGDFSDNDGTYAIEWTFVAVHDLTWTRAFKIELTNENATL